MQGQLKAAEEQRKQARNDHKDARSSISRPGGSGTIDEQVCILHHSWQLWGVMSGHVILLAPTFPPLF